MNHTCTQTRNAHWQAVVRLLRECDQHLEALDLPTFPELPAFLRDSGQLSAPDSPPGTSCDGREDHIPSSRPRPAGTGDTDCIIIPFADFEQLFHDMITMHDMLDELIGIQERKAALSKSMMEIAGKLDLSASECKSIHDITDRMETIADRWADMDITSIKQQ